MLLYKYSGFDKGNFVDMFMGNKWEMDKKRK
jgi:hypothetical protein